MKVQRLLGNPIIRPNMDGRMGTNINGPSLIRTPVWMTNALGRYHLYFADHNGTYIRLAFADDLAGPWRTHEPGTLQLSESFGIKHVASPDVHVDDDRREIRMYYHSPVPEGGQRTRVAVSRDGISFKARPEILGSPYFRVFQWDGSYYGLGMPGIMHRSRDGLTDFEQGPTLFPSDMRHSALRLRRDVLEVYYSIAGAAPEAILMSEIDLISDWQSWNASTAEKILEPETDYEGAGLQIEPSRRGAIDEPVRQLRDPCIFEEDGTTYLLYSVAGESGIAMATLSE